MLIGPEGDLSQAPLPSASILFAHDPEVGEGSWARFVVVQVMSMPTDKRRFERYRVAAILDIGGDGHREILVRGRSELGDRFRLFALRSDEIRFNPIGQWVGAAQVDGAPASKKED